MMNSIAMMSAERDIKVAGTTLAYMASAMDVLDQQAGVDLLDNYIIIDGKYRAAVYVDDKLVSNISQLQRMSTSRIDRISIIINPDAEYDKGIYALIKITMLKAEGKKISHRQAETSSADWCPGRIVSLRSADFTRLSQSPRTDSQGIRAKSFLKRGWI